MAKIHVNSKGETGDCHAEKGGCPFGGAEAHYSSHEEGRKAFEANQDSFSNKLKKEPVLNYTSVDNVLTTMQNEGLIEFHPAFMQDSGDAWTELNARGVRSKVAIATFSEEEALRAGKTNQLHVEVGAGNGVDSPEAIKDFANRLTASGLTQVDNDSTDDALGTFKVHPGGVTIISNFEDLDTTDFEEYYSEEEDEEDY